MSNNNDEAAQSLLNSNEIIQIESSDVDYDQYRSQRESKKMTGLLVCFVVFALVSVVYGVKYAVNDKYLYSTEGKIQVVNNYYSPNVSTYKCLHDKCVRSTLVLDEIPISLESCNMLCSIPSLWPKPRSMKLVNQTSSTFIRNSIILQVNTPNGIKKDVRRAFNIFMNNLPRQPYSSQPGVDLERIYLNIKVATADRRPKLDTNESYSLKIKSNSNIVNVNITADSFFGARHGLETLSQLIWLDSVSQKLQIYHDIEIEDKPAFAHRGLMVDTARNFFPMKQLLKVVDGMAANKLNVFHLHLTDSVSFPIILPTNPWMAEYGAYGPQEVYTPDDIKGLVEYARIRGIRIVLEIDAPSHVNEGWNHANKEGDEIVICGEADVNNGQLNPDNPRSFKLLEEIYSDLLQLGTDNETFHIGGDEVNLNCYRDTDTANQFTDIYDFWADLNNNIFKTVEKAFKKKPPKNIVIWSSDLTDKYMKYLKYSNNLVVQYWYGKIDPILSNGNKIIFSTVGKWYLDCGFGPWKSKDTHGSCDPYTHWKVFYNYRPWAQYTNYMKQVMGGEACLWTEQVDVDSLETRIWPRAAATAERLWSDIPVFDNYDVSTRLTSQRDRLIDRGIRAAVIWPEWCTLHPGKC